MESGAHFQLVPQTLFLAHALGRSPEPLIRRFDLPERADEQESIWMPVSTLRAFLDAAASYLDQYQQMYGYNYFAPYAFRTPHIGTIMPVVFCDGAVKNMKGYQYGYGYYYGTLLSISDGQDNSWALTSYYFN